VDPDSGIDMIVQKRVQPLKTLRCGWAIGLELRVSIVLIKGFTYLFEISAGIYNDEIIGGLGDANEVMLATSLRDDPAQVARRSRGSGNSS
jgi:hypothetical protein